MGRVQGEAMVTNVPPDQVSSYLQYLPAIFQEGADEHGVTFLGRFLLAFERILSGLGDGDGAPSLEERIESIHTYFDPRPLREGESPNGLERAPDEFLPWLAGWVALSLRQDWEEEEKRRFISRMVPLYRKRGTKAGLKEILTIYTGDRTVEIYEDDPRPHYFKVSMSLDVMDPGLLRRKQLIARAIIDQEKPAHTYYDLEFQDLPTLQVGVHSTVGVDTLLGSRRASDL
jgi:phage tail-like protein